MSLDRVLSALGHPIRLAIVRTLAEQGETYCGAVETSAPPSTMTGHWRVLRESGVVRQRVDGRRHYMALRQADIDALWPGLLDTVLRDETAPR
ncbi:transcriptional regulator [Brevibacterium sp. S111]|nr:transcriptional regulator [Brevibacterium sp. S111]